MNSMKINWENVKRKLNNLKQVHMKYRKMDIWKVNEFNFLNEEAEEFTSRWTQHLVNRRSPSYLKQKYFEYCFWGINRLYIVYSFFHLGMVMCC